MLLNQLRERTRSLHARLEASLDLMSPALTRARYTQLLKRFYGFHAPVERVLLEKQAWRDLGLPSEERRKVPAMQADLSAVGLDQSEIDSGRVYGILDVTRPFKFGVVNFTVQSWTGISWTTVATIAGNNLVKRTVSFPAIATDRIRISITGAADGWSRLTEIEAWGN